MTANGWFQIFLFFAAVLLVTKPVGVFLYRVFEGKPTFLDFALRPVERLVYRLCVKYRPLGAAILLRRNLLIYGVPGN